MKTEIWVSFNYGGWSLIFSKYFDLPFPPFHGMSLLDEKGTFENDISLETNDFCRTLIQYKPQDQSFYVDVRNVWKWPVTNAEIDRTLILFMDTGWTQEDDTDIDALKELMNRDAKR